MPAYDPQQRPYAGPGFDSEGGRFRRNLVRVVTVQAVSLLLLWLLEWRYDR